MDNKLSKQYLYSLGIYELRTIARKAEIKSPTTRKKDELIELILKRQSGMLEEKASNKGRKPKEANIVIPNAIKKLCEEDKKIGLLEYVDDADNLLVFNDNYFCDCINNKKFSCFGIVRQSDGNIYLYNYSNSINYIIIEEDFALKHKIELGDFIVGEAEMLCDNVASLVNIQIKNFNTYNQSKNDCEADAKFKLVKDAKRDELNKQFENCKDIVNLFVEIEADALSVKKLSENFYCIYSAEAIRLENSFNALVDLTKTLTILNKGNIKFNIVIYNIDYIFTILDAFYRAEGNKSDIEAGQCIKQIFSLINVKNCEKCIIVEKGNQKRNLYLDSILNKYI